jgi:hypothetical protein
MEQEYYETTVKFLNGALTMLQCAHDEVVEFAVTGLERELIVLIHDLVLKVNWLSNRVIKQQRSMRVLGDLASVRTP